MKKEFEFEIDINLLHLQNTLLDLSNYTFSEDIINKINELKELVEQKLYYNEYITKNDIDNFKYKIEFFINN